MAVALTNLAIFLSRIYNRLEEFIASFLAFPEEITSYGKIKLPIRGIEFQSDTRERIRYSKYELIVQDYDYYVEKGIRYVFKIVEWIDPEPDLIHSVYIRFPTQDAAYEAAKDSGMGRQPLFHRAHRRLERDHYHIANHYYVKCDRWHKKLLVNLHFNFGPRRIFY